MTLVQSRDVKKPFGAAVRSWRGRLGLSQEQLAGRAGLHRTYVCDVERGARNLSLESIDKLARALEVSAATLLACEIPPGDVVTQEFVGDGLVDILFAEDNPLDAEITLEALRGITNRVRVVHDGQAALDFLFCRGEFARRRPGGRPQLLLLDLNLPKMGGLEVLRRVKADARTAAIPVVVLTGSDSGRDLRLSKRLGAAAYIVKPVDMANLSRVAPALRLRWALLKPSPTPA